MNPITCDGSVCAQEGDKVAGATIVCKVHEILPAEVPNRLCRARGARAQGSESADLRLQAGRGPLE